MNKELAFLGKELNLIANELYESMYIKNDIVQFDENKIENASTKFKKIQNFVKTANLERIETVRKGLFLFSFHINHFANTSSLSGLLNLTVLQAEVSFKPIIIGLMTISAMIEYLSNEQTPELSVFWVHNLTSSDFFIDYSTFMSKAQELDLLKAHGCTLTRTTILSNKMPIYTRAGVIELDISKFKVGEIHEVAINFDKLGNLVIEPFAIDF